MTSESSIILFCAFFSLSEKNITLRCRIDESPDNEFVQILKNEHEAEIQNAEHVVSDWVSLVRF